MHVLMTTDTIGGVWTYSCDLVSGYLRRGVDVCLVCLGRRFSGSQWEDVRSLSECGPGLFECISTDYKLEWMEDCEDDLMKSADFLYRIITDRNPDLLHFNQFCYGALPVDIPKIVVAHSDVISWWRAVHGNDPDESQWIQAYRRWVTNGLHGAELVVAPTKWMADQIQDIYGYLPRLHVIPNGINLEGQEVSQQKHLRAVSLGRLWDKGKQIRILEQARARIPIYVAGDLIPPGEGETVPVESAINCVHYLGPLARGDVRKLLATSAIYVVTSRYEPFGLAPVEAAASGCAIVANDLPSLREIWGDTIYYFERNNPEALGALLDWLAGGEQGIADAGRRAREFAISHLNCEQMVEQYLQLCGEFVQEGVCQ